MANVISKLLESLESGKLKHSLEVRLCWRSTTKIESRLNLFLKFGPFRAYFRLLTNIPKFTFIIVFKNTNDRILIVAEIL